MTEGTIYVGGAFRPAADASVSVFDHGLLYGDGVFEGIRAYNGRVFKLERHIERLFDSANAIRLQIPATRDEVQALVVEEHLDRRGDLAASETEDAVQHPSRLDKDQVRYPRALLDEPFGRRDLLGVVAREETYKNICINRAHAVS